MCDIRLSRDTMERLPKEVRLRCWWRCSICYVCKGPHGRDSRDCIECMLSPDNTILFYFIRTRFSPSANLRFFSLAAAWEMIDDVFPPLNAAVHRLRVPFADVIVAKIISPSWSLASGHLPVEKDLRNIPISRVFLYVLTNQGGVDGGVLSMT